MKMDSLGYMKCISIRIDKAIKAYLLLRVPCKLFWIGFSNS